MTATIHLFEFAHKGIIDECHSEHLPALQRRRFTELKSTRAISFYWSRTFLLHLLSEYGSDWIVEERVDLPPNLRSTAQDAPPAFSISHSAGLLAIAVGSPTEDPSSAVGLDVEKLDSGRSIAAAKLFCSVEQQAMILNQPVHQQADSMIALWTQKEAWFKKSNTPVINPHLKSLHFESAPPRQADLFTTKLNQRFYMSIACFAGPPNVVAYCLDREQHHPVFKTIDSELAITNWDGFKGKLLA